ncbi:replication initiation protein [Persicitalea jodogahamensis]|uniref:Initiator Rep protein WH1 domain-containing protein n=1 Tax=Persicitalea jodogahamensis TaxID=402147 RepID=A0A8J3DDV1_9BACT|nr:replication initiation protein [Persicitalea jodogahamensis]GHB87305.1 hypothetical protein GCM10007390_48900 [Persicitalea jodogahamensis]
MEPDNKNTLPPLPAVLTYQPEHQQVVKQHWNVTFARQKKMTPMAKRIMALVIDQIRDDDFELRPHYQFKISDLASKSDLSTQTLYNYVEAALRELARVTWEFQKPRSKDSKNPKDYEWYVRNLLDTTKDERVGYQDGIVTVLLNPQLAPYFIQIAHYSKFQVESYMHLRSWYSMRFFEILSAFRDKGEWFVSIDEYRQLMDCWEQKDIYDRVKKDKKGNPVMKYPSTKDLITYTVTEPIEELKDTNLAFDYEPIYEQGGGRRGRPRIIALNFKLLHPQTDELPSEWQNHPKTAHAIEGMRRFKVSDRNLRLYAKDIGSTRILQLLREWQIKEASDKRIDDRAKYCNAVFIREGKAAQAREYKLYNKEVSERVIRPVNDR